MVKSKKILESKEDPLNEILNIKANYDRSFLRNYILSVTGIEKTTRFIEKYLINGTSIEQLVDYKKFNSLGHSQSLSEHQKVSKPSSVIVSHLVLAQNYSESVEKNPALVLIDGSIKYSKDLQELDSIIRKGIKTLVVVDSTDINQLNFLKERDYLFWFWDKDNLNQVLPIEDLEGFFDFNKKLVNYLETKIEINECVDLQISLIVESVLEFASKFNRDNSSLIEIKIKLIYLLLSTYNYTDHISKSILI